METTRDSSSPPVNVGRKAALLGVLACGLCCLGPILAAIGVSGAALSVVTRWAEPAAFALLLVGMLSLGALVLKRRRAAAASATQGGDCVQSCDVGCGCNPQQGKSR